MASNTSSFDVSEYFDTIEGGQRLKCKQCKFACPAKRIPDARRHLSSKTAAKTHKLGSGVGQVVGWCPCCIKDFRQAEHYRNHFRMIHAGGPEPEIFRCAVTGCTQRFRERNQAERHARKEHKDVEPASPGAKLWTGSERDFRAYPPMRKSEDEPIQEPSQPQQQAESGVVQPNPAAEENQPPRKKRRTSRKTAAVVPREPTYQPPAEPLEATAPPAGYTQAEQGSVIDLSAPLPVPAGWAPDGYAPARQKGYIDPILFNGSPMFGESATSFSSGYNSGHEGTSSADSGAGFTTGPYNGQVEGLMAPEQQPSQPNPPFGSAQESNGFLAEPNPGQMDGAQEDDFSQFIDWDGQADNPGQPCDLSTESTAAWSQANFEGMDWALCDDLLEVSNLMQQNFGGEDFGQ